MTIEANYGDLMRHNTLFAAIEPEDAADELLLVAARCLAKAKLVDLIARRGYLSYGATPGIALALLRWRVARVAIRRRPHHVEILIVWRHVDYSIADYRLCIERAAKTIYGSSARVDHVYIDYTLSAHQSPITAEVVAR